MQPISNTNSFFGIRVSQPGIDVLTAGPNQLVYQSDYTTQTWYGINGNPTLNIGNIGTTNNPQYGMSVPASNGTITFGENTDGTQGMQVVDSTGYVLFEMNGTTWYWYDKATNTNVMQIGLLPDGTYGMAIAKSGYNVSDGIT